MIEILFHYHTRAIDYDGLHHPEQQDTLSYFLKNGYLTKNALADEMPAGTMNYSPTEKLSYYCDALCAMPEPKQVWVIGS